MTEELIAPFPSNATTVVSSTAPTLSAPVIVRTRWLWLALAVLAGLSVASLAVAWNAGQREASLEQELVRRQQESSGQAAEAKMLAKQAQENVAEAAAKVALLDAKVAEVAVQRSQLEDLIQSLSRSRDENILVDVEAAIRVALQQSAITGSAEPLVSTLKQSGDRLARYNQPRLEGVRRAIARDLDRTRATSTADISSLGIKLDEAIRMVDELPMLASAEPRKEGARTASAAKAASVPGSGASAPLVDNGPAQWSAKAGQAWSDFSGRVWNEVRALVRVTRIDNPDAMLVAPEQSFFLRENLKLRLLNARLALLSRQFDTAQSDLQAAQQSLDRYFEKNSKRTLLAMELIKQVSAQAKQVGVPRPDDTLAALTAASAGR